MSNSPGKEKSVESAGLEIPGPEGYPFVGVIPKLWGDPLAFFVEMGQRYWPIARLDMGPETMLLASAPEAVQYVLQGNNRNYRKGYEPVKPLIGEGLVTSEGEFWLRQRRLMQPMFHRRRIEGFAETMVEATAEMLDEWEAYAASGKTFDLAAEVMKLTQRIIALTMFSADVGDQTDVLCDAFLVGLEYMNQRMFTPIPHIERLPTPTNMRFKRALATLDEITYSLIEERRALLRATPEGAPDDLLTMLLEAQDADTGEQMTDKQIRDEVVTIFFAGHETTASTLAWACYLLGRRPDVAEQLVAEVQEVLAGDRPGFSTMGELTYTRQVIDETLRLFPPAWMFARLAIEDDEICGYHVPAGRMIMLSPYVAHRDPREWEQPYRFDPSRFAPDKGGARHRYAYFPFGGGPRLCIGSDFSLVESTLIMAMIAQRYDVYLEPDSRVKAEPVVTLRPQPGVMVSISKRGL